MALECVRGTFVAWGGGAEWRGLGAADSRENEVEFLIKASILGLSASRSVVGAAFMHTRNSHLFQSPPY